MSKAAKKRNALEVSKSKDVSDDSALKKSKVSKKEKASTSDSDNEDLEIFARLEKNPADLPKIGEDLKSLLLTSGDKAMNQLIIFTLDSMGCTEYTFQLDRSKGINIDDVIEKIQKSKFQIGLNDVPLYGKGKTWKNFRRDFADFWSSFIKNVANEILVESGFLKIFVKLILKHVSVKLRTVRYSCIETLLAIFVALGELHSTYTEELRQVVDMSAEVKVTRQKKAAEASKKECEKIIAKTEALLDLIYNELYLKRSEDAMVEIRLRILDSLFAVENLLPSYFTKEQTRNLIKQFLLDEEAVVVLQTLELLKKMMTSNTNEAAKNMLLGQLRPCLIELAMNIDSNVAEKALTFISQYSERIEMKEQDLKNLCALIFYPALCVTKGAASLINAVYFENTLLPAKLVEEDQLPFVLESKTSKEQLLKLAQIVQKYTEEDINQNELCESFVQAFLGISCVFFDIQAAFGIIQDHSKIQKSASRKQLDRILLKFLNCAVSQALSVQSKRAAYDKTLVQVTSKCLEFVTEYVAKNLLARITETKFESELLVEILSLFDKIKSELFSGNHVELPFEDILKVLKDVLIRTQDKEVVPVISRFLAIVKKHRVSTEKQIKAIIEEFEGAVVDIIDSVYAKIKADPNDRDLLATLDLNLYKFHQIAVHFELKAVHDANFVDKIAEFATLLTKSNTVSDKAIVSCLNILFYTHLWRLNEVFKTSNISRQYLGMRQLLVDKLVSFLDSKHLNSILISKGIDPTNATAEQKHAIGTIQEKAFSLLTELLSILLSNRFRSVNYLEFTFSREILTAMRNFIETPDTFDSSSQNWNVFSSESKKIVEDIEGITEITYDKEQGLAERRNLNVSNVSAGEPGSPSRDQTNRTVDNILTGALSKSYKIEKLEFTCSLFCKLLITSTRALEQENFSARTFLLYYSHANDSIRKLLRDLLLKIIANDNEMRLKDPNAGSSFWRFVLDILKVGKDQESENSMLPELIKMIVRTYFDAAAKEKPELQSLMTQRYLRFLVDGIAFSLRENTNLTLLKYIGMFLSKGHVQISDYKKILAFFELELQKRMPDEKENESIEGEQEADTSAERKAEKAKRDAIIAHFRKILAKAAGMKRIEDKSTRSHDPNVRRSARLKQNQSVDEQRIQLDTYPTSSTKRNRGGQGAQEESAQKENARASTSTKQDKKRRSRPAYPEDENTEDSKAMREMVEGPSRSSRVRPKNIRA